GRAILRHPDAVLLRDAAGGGAILAGPGHWRCLLVAAADLPVRRIAVPLFNGEHAAVLPDQELLSRVKKALDFRYPHRESCTYPAKWTVSRLVAADDMEGKWQKVGGGAEDDREQAALRGTVNHLILEKLDFSQDLGAQIEQLQKGGILTAAQADAADIPMLEDFLHSELGRRMAAADRLEREISFTMTIGAEDFVPSHPGDRIILQGTMDAAFWEQNGWVLVDYKTGGFGKTKQQLQQRYQGQLHYYRQAIERIWRQPVKEMYLYMLDQRQSLLLAVE
ncbi:MAG: PD-(D/E)XK nuclease family protein, partial [Clostridiales bacterium]